MGSQLSRWYSWAVLPALLVLNLVYSQRVVQLSGWYVTVFLVVAAAGCFAGLVLFRWLPGRAGLWGSSRLVLMLFGALVAWAALSGIGRDRQVMLPEINVVTAIPTWAAYFPFVETLFAVAFAWLLVAAIRDDDLERRLFQVSALMLACGLIGQLRAFVSINGVWRLDTGLGGAATLPVIFVLVAAALVGLAVVNYRRGWSIGLACVSVVELVLTGSRAGLGVLALFAALAGIVWWFRSGMSHRQRLMFVGVLAGVALLAVVLVLTVPGLDRVLTLDDPARAENVRVGWALATKHWQTLLFGVGLGVVWPWFAMDAGLVPLAQAPHGWITVPGADGHLLASPHSLFAGVLIEFGVVGLVLLLAFLTAIVQGAWRARRQPLAGTLLLGVCATFLAFIVDSYLLKNFGVSWLWWFFVLAGLRLSSRDAAATSDAA